MHCIIGITSALMLPFSARDARAIVCLDPFHKLVSAMQRRGWHGGGASSGGAVAASRQALATADAELMHKHGIQPLVGDWLGWRKRFAVRAQSLTRTLKPRPGSKMDQLPWHTYRSLKQNGTMDQEWLYAPFLVAALVSQPLTGQQASRRLWQGNVGQVFSRHYTDIHRVRALAQEHPLIEEVEFHKLEKGNEAPNLNKWAGQ